MGRGGRERGSDANGLTFGIGRQGVARLATGLAYEQLGAADRAAQWATGRARGAATVSSAHGHNCLSARTDSVIIEKIAGICATDDLQSKY